MAHGEVGGRTCRQSFMHTEYRGLPADRRREGRLCGQMRVERKTYRILKTAPRFPDTRIEKQKLYTLVYTEKEIDAGRERDSEREIKQETEQGGESDRDGQEPSFPDDCRNSNLIYFARCSVTSRPCYTITYICSQMRKLAGCTKRPSYTGCSKKRGVGRDNEFIHRSARGASCSTGPALGG